MTLACILATGRPAYAFAARQAATALLRHTQFDIVVGCDETGALLLPTHPRLKTVEIPASTANGSGERFLAKFALLEKTSAERDDQLVLLIDSDAILTGPLSDDVLTDALRGKSVGMAEQTQTIPDGTTRTDLYRHYQDVTFAALGAAGEPARPENFRYYNSGVVVFSREGLSRFLGWYRVQPKRTAFADRMIADQDYLQVFANEVLRDDAAELPGTFNHSALWHENYPSPDAIFRHFSNYCNGPDLDALHQMLELNQSPSGDPDRHQTIAQQLVATPLTVIIVTFNSAATLPLCLDLLADYACDVIVVDNASSDDTREIAARAGVRVIRNDENLGFGVACNIGEAAARTEILCFLNPDCLLTREGLSQAVRQIEHDPVALYTPDFVEWSGETVHGRQPGYTRLKLVADILENTRLRRITRWLRRTRALDDPSWHWPLAACLFVHRDTFRTIGGFDESFWLYMEDVRLGEAAARRGIPTLGLGCTVVHFGSMGSSTSGSARQELLVAGRLHYAATVYGQAFARLLALVYAATRRRGEGRT